MKINKSILIVGAAVIGLASCEPEMTQPTEEQIDAKVQELVSQRRSELQAQCDADLLAAANMEADKIIMASANQPAAAAPAPAPRKAAPATPSRPAAKKKAVAKTPAKKVAEPVKQTKGGLKGSSDQSKAKNKNTVEGGGGLKAASDKSKANNKNTVEGGGGLKSKADK